MKEVEFGTLFQFIRNGMSVKQDKSAGGLPITRIETISDGTVNTERVGYAGLNEDRCRKWMLEPGDILFSHINSAEHVGKCAVYRGSPEKLIHGMNLLCLRPDAKLLDVEFGKYLIRGPAFRSRLSAFVNKAVNQASVSTAHLKAIRVEVPPLDEQRRIAAILDQADALGRKRHKHLERLSGLALARFQSMFGDPLGQLARYPSTELASIVDPLRPITYGILKPGPDIPNGVPYVRVVDIKRGRLLTDQMRRTSAEISSQYRRSALRGGDLLISIRGHVGRMARVPNSVDGANITQDTARLAIVGANPVFIRALLEHPLSIRWLADHTRGIAVQGINLGDLRRFPVILPPRTEQESFAEFCAVVDRYRDAGERQLAHFDSLVTSLQHRAFRGEL